MKMSRRRFLERAGVGTAVAGLVAARGTRIGAEPLGIPLGSQTYPERQMVADGKFVDLMKNMYAAGIRQIELCSPGYAQFKSLADGKQTRKIIEDNGLKCISAHFTLVELRTALPAAIQWAQDVGMTQMGTASLGSAGVNGVQSLNQIRYAAEEYNRIAATVKRAGLQQFLHNEALENSRLEDGRLTYPVLLEYLDPDLVKMQFQMSSMPTIGNPIMYFLNHPGRFISAHVHGVTLAAPVANTGNIAMPIKTDTPAPAPGGARAGGTPVPGVAVGDDDVDWPKVFAAAKIGGVKNYFIEQEQPQVGWDLMVKGAKYLKTLS